MSFAAGLVGPNLQCRCPPLHSARIRGKCKGLYAVLGEAAMPRVQSRLVGDMSLTDETYLMSLEGTLRGAANRQLSRVQRLPGDS
jgi:hypothetical protein